KPENVNVHGAVGHHTVASPDRIQKLLPAEDRSRVAHQKLQQAELCSSERYRPAVRGDPAGAAVELERSGPQQSPVRTLRTELDPDSGDQFPEREWLHHIIVGAQLQAENPVCLRRASRQEDYREVGPLRVGANCPADLQAVLVWQHDVQNQQVRTLPPAQLDGCFAGLRARHVKPFFLEIVFQQAEEVGIIFNQGDLLHDRDPTSEAITRSLQRDYNTENSV